MTSRSRLHHLNVSLPAKDLRVYVFAVKILARIMGRKAPAVLVLIEHNLRGRDAISVADDYLDAIGWPLAKGRAVSLRRQDLSPIRSLSRAVFVQRPRPFIPRIDPGRN